MIAPPRNDWLFVYGSLQPGSWNHRAFFGENPAEWPTAYPACTYGRVALAYPQRQSYPVARFDEPGVVVGHVIQVDLLSPTWMSIYAMEWNAGYHLVELQMSPGPQVVLPSEKALSFEYDLPIHDRVSVPMGDWLAWHLS